MEKALTYSYADHCVAIPRRLGTSSPSLALKRSFDIIFSIIAIIILSPIALLIYLSIRLSGSGCAIFSQTRIGRGGKPFTLYKFRSMRPDAESDGEARLATDNDHRLTRIGRFIRNHHIDELPQLWNVLRGDMSFVGYRPERQIFIDMIMQHNKSYRLLFRLRPGLFSYATLYNGYTDTMEKMLIRLKMDLDYMNRRNFFVDLKIITLTAFSILSGKKF